MLLEVGRYFLTVLRAACGAELALLAAPGSSLRAARAEFSLFLMGGNEALNGSELLMVPVDLRILGKRPCY